MKIYLLINYTHDGPIFVAAFSTLEKAVEARRYWLREMNPLYGLSIFEHEMDNKYPSDRWLDYEIGTEVDVK